MVLDFTLDKYRELCSALLENHYVPLSFSQYLSESNNINNRLVIIRHDIDRKLLNSLRMAELENELGLRSTYYFRYPYTFKPEIIKKIHNLGHEVGYHYEVLSKAGGDFDIAIKLFEYELARFREICDVRTICMHGRPLSRFDNRALWDTYNFKDFGIMGEAYLSVAEDTDYFSDTGRTWSDKNSIRDFIPGKKSRFSVNDTDELIRFLEHGKACKIYILLHPERWAINQRDWYASYLMDHIFNIGKIILKEIRK